MNAELPRFEDRRGAGCALAELLAPARGTEAVVLGLSRGGVPVAHEVAIALHLPMDVLVTRRLYAPHDPSLVLGAVAETGAVWLNERELRHAGVDPSELSEPIVQESLEVARIAQRYRQWRTRRSLESRTVLLIDDGLVTGATARAGLIAVRALAPRSVVLAVPIADAEVADAVRGSVDALVVAHRVAELGSLERWYQEFSPVSEGEVIAVLAGVRREAEVALDAAVP
jgi:putative phosphoribosyl transferase